MAREDGPFPWGPVLVGVLAVVVGVLVFFALRPPGPPATLVVQSPAATPTESPAPTPAATATPERTTAPVPPGPLRERPLDVQSATVAVRAIPGACPGGGAGIELTVDGGASWVAVETPADQVMRVSWPEAPDLWFAGASGDCTPGFWRSEDQGATWADPTDTAGAWHLLPDPASLQLHAPDGDIDSPCGASGTLEVESLPPDGAFVLCGDGGIQRTGDSGASWQQVAAASGTLALGVVDGDPLVVQPGGEGCDGLVVGSALTEERSCVEGAQPQGVAVAFAGPDAGFLLAGDLTWVSSDGGLSWQAS